MHIKGEGGIFTHLMSKHYFENYWDRLCVFTKKCDKILILGVFLVGYNASEI